MTLKLKLGAKPPNSKFSDGPKDKVKIVRSVILHTANKIAKEIRNLGRSDIKAAGNFGKKFTAAFFSKRLPKSTVANQTIVRIGSHIPFFDIFEFGGVVVGKPLLWIPIGDAKLPRASAYEATFNGAKLVQITSKKGTPLLVVNANPKAGIKGELLYFGVTSIREPKLFHIRQISASQSARAGEYYRTYMNQSLDKK